jgi:hypothetical protein
LRQQFGWLLLSVALVIGIRLIYMLVS